MKYLFTLFMCVLTSVVLTSALSRLSAVQRGGRQRGLLGWILYELRRGDALRQRNEEIQQSRNMKDAAVAALVSGRLTLSEALEQFASADELVEDGNNDLVGCSRRLPHTEEERCREIIDWARIVLFNDPRRAEQVIERIECELGRDPKKRAAEASPH
jgi:hypothetical protein